VPEATACASSVVADTIMRTIELGVTITDAAIDNNATTVFCAPVARDPRCPDCGRDGRYRDTITRPLTDLPVAGYPLVLRVAVPRYRCLTPECGRVVSIASPSGAVAVTLSKRLFVIQSALTSWWSAPLCRSERQR
jgi:transposase